MLKITESAFNIIISDLLLQKMLCRSNGTPLTETLESLIDYLKKCHDENKTIITIGIERD